jgi:ribosome-associated toxin RatA of RatAB toxin-antitoxin module
MPQVKSKVQINAPFDTVWALAQNVEDFPRIMPDLDSVELLEKSEIIPGNTRTLTKWRAQIKQFKRTIVWTEEDIWNRKSGECQFAQKTGDFQQYQGVWKFSPVEGGTELNLELNYVLEVPLIGALMKNVIQKLMQANVDMMSGALKKEGERLAKG